MVVYADTSFLVSIYGRDANSEEAQRLASTLSGPFAFTPLHRHEARNAVRLAVFRNDITPQQCEAVLQAMTDDVSAGVLAASPVAWAEVFEKAETLSASHAATLGSRALDLLHVAAAAVLGIQSFFTYDNRQKSLARLAGMAVHPD